MSGIIDCVRNGYYHIRSIGLIARLRKQCNHYNILDKFEYSVC